MIKLQSLGQRNTSHLKRLLSTMGDSNKQNVSEEWLKNWSEKYQSPKTTAEDKTKLIDELKQEIFQSTAKESQKELAI